MRTNANLLQIFRISHNHADFRNSKRPFFIRLRRRITPRNHPHKILLKESLQGCHPGRLLWFQKGTQNRTPKAIKITPQNGYKWHMSKTCYISLPMIPHPKKSKIEIRLRINYSIENNQKSCHKMALSDIIYRGSIFREVCLRTWIKNSEAW